MLSIWPSLCALTLVIYKSQGLSDSVDISDIIRSELYIEGIF